MNVAGGAGSRVGDLPIFISAIKPDSVIGRCSKIQVSEYHIHICSGLYDCSILLVDVPLFHLIREETSYCPLTTRH